MPITSEEGDLGDGVDTDRTLRWIATEVVATLPMPVGLEQRLDVLVSPNGRTATMVCVEVRVVACRSGAAPALPASRCRRMHPTVHDGASEVASPG